MQASLNDLSTRRDSQSFVICQRVLHKCHEIIFGDQLLPLSSPYSGLLPPTYRRPKIKHHAEPVFVGLGVLLAGSPAMPQLAQLIGPVAIEQGRADEEGDESTGLESSLSPATKDDTDDPDSIEGLEDPVPQLPVKANLVDSNTQQVGLLGQLNPDENMPYQSSPSLVSAHAPSRVATINRADSLLEKYDTHRQVQLLQGHYYSSEVRHMPFPLLDGFDIQEGSILAQS